MSNVNGDSSSAGAADGEVVSTGLKAGNELQQSDTIDCNKTLQIPAKH